MREFNDDAGTSWQVVQVEPESASGRPDLLPPSMRGGWLVFDSRGQRRRLSPVPADWESLPEQRLLHLCEMAVPATQLRLD